MKSKVLRIIVALVFMFLLLGSSLGVVYGSETVSYRVQWGDTLWKIAQNHNTTISNLKAANGLTSDYILAGQALRVTASQSTSNYRVQWGDTLWKIAQRYNTSAAQLKVANNLTSDQIITGQILRVPNSTASVSTNNSRFSSSDIELLARLVGAEARGESYIGQVAVAATVLNRVKSSSYPNTISGVVYQVANGFIQYCPVRDGSINRPASETARSAARDAINGWDPSNGAVSFYNPRTATNAWIRTRPVTAVIGNHMFVR